MCDKIHYDELDARVTSLEKEVGELRSETRIGLAAVNSNINLLSQQITNMDMKLMEREKWGDTLRGCVRWVVRGLVAVAVYAAGVNISESFFSKVFVK